MSLKVFIVDDDAAMRDSIALMLGLRGFSTEVFACAEDLLASWKPDWMGCIVADLKLAGMTGIELQSTLRARSSVLPVVVITAHGDVGSARAAFLADAVDFLEKPFSEASLLSAIDDAMGREKRRGDAVRETSELRRKLARLTPREGEVLALVGQGLHAKEIAAVMGISPRTVEVHKSRLMIKLEARNLSELVRYSLESKAR